jgi:hypothetical protein
MRLKRVVAIVLAALFTARAAAAGHVVGESDIQAAIEEASQRRQEDAATLDGFLAKPLTVETARNMGLDVDRLKVQAARLSDGELHDLAARAQALETDPVAGGPIGFLLGLVLLIALILLVLIVLGVAECEEEGICD